MPAEPAVAPGLTAALPPYRPNVGVMLVDPRGRVFTGLRADRPPGTEAWQMPQGGIDPGETPLEAALRELEEETGIPRAKVEVLSQSAGWIHYDLPAELQGKLWQGRWRGQKQKWFLMRFLGSNALINICRNPAEFTAWRWSPVEALVADIVPFKRDVYEQVVAEFAPLL